MRAKWRLRGAGRARALLVLSAALLGTAIFFVPGAAEAGEPNARTAEHLFREARALIAHKDYAAACPMLEESLRLDPAPGTEFNLARCYELEGRFASASRAYAAVAEAMRTASESRREKVALARIADIAPHLSFVRISLPADLAAQVTLDGRELAAGEIGAPVPVDRGAHVIAASAPGKRPWDTKVTVDAEGATVPVTIPPLEEIAVPPPASPPAVAEEPPPTSTPPAASPAPVQETPPLPPPSRPLGAARIAALSLGGLAIVGAGVGTYFGIEAFTQKDNHQVSQSHTDGDASDVSFVAAGTLAAGALVLWFTAPSAPARQITLVPGLGREPSLYLTGRF